HSLSHYIVSRFRHPRSFHSLPTRRSSDLSELKVTRNTNTSTLRAIKVIPVAPEQTVKTENKVRKENRVPMGKMELTENKVLPEKTVLTDSLPKKNGTHLSLELRN